MSAAELTLAYLARTDSPFWQRCLRRSVRLLLALDEPGVDPAAVQTGLHLIEQELEWDLTGSDPVLLATETARAIIKMEQAALLGDRAERAALLADCSTAQYHLPPAAEAFSLCAGVAWPQAA